MREAYDLYKERMAEHGANCVMRNLTMTARTIVSLWDEAFRPAGLTANQYQILAVLATLGDSNLKTLAERLNTDTTTISRTIKNLSKMGLLKIVAGKDARNKMLGLSAKGKRKFCEGTEVWFRIQERFLGEAGAAEWERTIKSLAGMRRAAKKLKAAA